MVAAILLAFFCGSYRAGGTFLRPGQQNSAQAQRQLDHLTQENALAAQRQESPALRANKVVAPGAAADNSGNAERQQANATQPTPQSAPLLEEAVAKQKILEQQLDDARSELVRLNKAHESDQTSMVGNQLRISQLSDQLKTAKQNATNMQKQLAAIGGDDRNVMGSRRLHVIDIRDTDQDGQPGKAFGRIFLTEGKSLVFYAFDLGDPARTDAQRAFQVWGQQEGKASSLRSLGFLNVDDKTQRRWALKSDDSASFDKINSIFVTVERRGGAKTPSGQHLLFAYLGEPNHP